MGTGARKPIAQGWASLDTNHNQLNKVISKFRQPSPAEHAGTPKGGGMGGVTWGRTDTEQGECKRWDASAPNPAPSHGQAWSPALPALLS